MLPTAHDLDDPDGFVHREQPDFSELDRILGEAASGGRKAGPDQEGRTQGDEATGTAGDDSATRPGDSADGEQGRGNRDDDGDGRA